MRRVAVGIYRAPKVCLDRQCYRIIFDESKRCHLHRPTSTSAKIGEFFRATHYTSSLPAAGTAKRKTTEYSPGVIFTESWKIGLELSRSEGPAIRRFDESGMVHYEEWRTHGHVSRFGGPARTFFRPDGTVKKESFFIAGFEFERSHYFTELAALSERDLCEGLHPAGWAEVLDRGGNPRGVVEALAAGLRTIEGVSAVAVDGAPVEWAKAFESAGS